MSSKNLNEFKNELSGLDYGSLTEMCNERFPMLPFFEVDFKNDLFEWKQREYGGSNVIYRARHITNDDNRPHDNVSEISYIPKSKIDKIKSYGRGNKPQESMFYGALKLPTTCVEAITKGNVLNDAKSTMLTVSVWKVEKPLTLVKIPHSEKYFKSFYEKVNFKSSKIQLEHIQNTNKEIRKQIANDSAYQDLMFFADAFAKWDIKLDHDYMLSNYYVDRAFSRIPGMPMEEKIDGIIYPSVAFSYQETNILLNPDTVDNKLKFLSAAQIWLVSFLESNKGAQFIPIEQQVKAAEDGSINWRYKMH